MKKYLHLPTQKILVQSDFNSSDKEGDFTFITSDFLANQSTINPYAFTVVAYLKDCKEIVE